MEDKDVGLELVQVMFPPDLIEKVRSRSKIRGDISRFIRDAVEEKLSREEEKSA